MYNYTTLYTELNQPCNVAHSKACPLFPKTTNFIQMMVYSLIYTDILNVQNFTQPDFGF